MQGVSIKADMHLSLNRVFVYGVYVGTRRAEGRDRKGNGKCDEKCCVFFSLSVLFVKLEDDCESVLYFPRYLLHVQQAIAMCV